MNQQDINTNTQNTGVIIDNSANLIAGHEAGLRTMRTGMILMSIACLITGVSLLWLFCNAHLVGTGAVGAMVIIIVPLWLMMIVDIACCVGFSKKTKRNEIKNADTNKVGIVIYGVLCVVTGLLGLAAAVAPVIVIGF